MKDDSTFRLTIASLASDLEILLTGHWNEAGTVEDGVLVRVTLEETDGEPRPPISPLIKVTRDEAVFEGWSARPILARLP